MPIAISVTEASDTGVSGEAGLMLVEMLVAVAMGLVVFAAALTALVSSLHASGREAAQSSTLQQAQVALARMVHDVRAALPDPASKVVVVSATAGASPTGSSITLKTATASGRPATTTYDCSGTAPASCRIVAGDHSITLLAGNLVNGPSHPVFTLECRSDAELTTSCSGTPIVFVKIDLRVQSTCEGRARSCTPQVVELQGGTNVRNAEGSYD